MLNEATPFPLKLDFKLEGLQAVVELSSIRTLCSRALRSQILHGKTTQKVASIYPTIKPFDATSCVVLRSLVWLCKTFETEAIVVCPTTAWSPSHTMNYHATNEGLQAVVAHSTFTLRA